MAEPVAEVLTIEGESKENDNIRVDLKILQVIKDSRLKHGLRLDDYEMYRKFCTRQLCRIRKKTKLKSLDPNNDKKTQQKNYQTNKMKKKRFKKIMFERKQKDRENGWNPKIKRNKFYKITKPKSTWIERKINENDIISVKDSWLILLYLIERAWTYSKRLYTEYDDDHSRKRHHSNARLKKAVKYANQLNNIIIKKGNAMTKLQMYLYLTELTSELLLQRDQDSEVEKCLKEFMKLKMLFEYMNGLKNRYIKKYMYIENKGNDINNKINFLKSKVNSKDKLREIEINVDTEINGFIKSIENEAKINAELLIDIDTDIGNDKKKDGYLFEFDETKDEIMQKSIVKLFKRYDDSIGKIIKERKIMKRLNMYTNVLQWNEELLTMIASELRKISDTSNEAKPLYLGQRYLEYNKLRLNIVRNAQWIDNNLYVLMGKQKNSKKSKDKMRKEHVLMYDCANLCENQVRMMDELTSLMDMNKYNKLNQEIQVLRESFDIQRSYFIGKIYYMNKEYSKSYTVFNENIITNGTEYVKTFNFEAKNNDNETMYNLSCFIDITNQKKIMENILNDTKKLQLMCKGYAALNDELKNVETINTNNNDKRDLLQKLDDINIDNCEHLIDLEYKMHALLPKPVLFDLSWNFIEYQGFTKKEEAKAKNIKSPNKQKSWLGGLFG